MEQKNQLYLREEPANSSSEIIDTYCKKFGWTIEGPSYSQVPEINQNIIKGVTLDCALRLRQHLLETYFIKDHLDDDHYTRREFKEKNPEIADWIAKHSKLRGNNLSTCLIEMVSIMEYLKKRHTDIYQRLNEVVPYDLFNSAAEYTKMKYEDKVAYAKNLMKLFLNF